MKGIRAGLSDACLTFASSGCWALPSLVSGMNVPLQGQERASLWHGALHLFNLLKDL